MKRSLASCLVSLLLACVSAGAAAAEGWVVDRIGPPVFLTTDGETWTAAEPGMPVPAAAWIQTGVRGRAVLRRGSEMVSVRPDSRVSLAEYVGPRPWTGILQSFGELLIDVDHEDAPHTTVITPFMAATVKGTRFEVSVSPDDARVSVAEGVVEATDLARGERTDVRAGQSLTVTRSAARPLRVFGTGRKAPVTRVAPSRSPVMLLRNRAATPAPGATTALLSEPGPASTGRSSGSGGSRARAKTPGGPGDGAGSGRVDYNSADDGGAGSVREGARGAGIGGRLGGGGAVGGGFGVDVAVTSEAAGRGRTVEVTDAAEPAGPSISVALVLLAISVAAILAAAISSAAVLIGREDGDGEPPGSTR